jgi:hypothetical protein
MDYSKQGGGTRVLDQLKARTLATGHGTTVAAARGTGSHRAEQVASTIKPGSICSDPGLCQLRDKRTADMKQGMVGLDPLNNGQQPVENRWPLESGSKSHANANGMFLHEHPSDQGEQHRVKTTGQKSKSIFTAPLSRGGK